ncbi:uncharacterized protein LOC107763085 isoform X4 [Nicotiana tabacum]|uniref:Uncharacterized protein LOC107763085 isoform X4 n=1 Tax=Nicotiana tabacum TaxID=4097 RepID=A0AC58SY36_TOBAC
MWDIILEKFNFDVSKGRKDEWKYLVNLWSGDDFQVQFDQLKEQQKEGEISLNDDDIFEKVCGAEKYGYLRAYGLGKNISEYFGGRPTKIQLINK